MSQGGIRPEPPRAILLATDLSSHCDRALDRAAQLARQWQATLHVVHALRHELRSVAWWSPEGDKSWDGPGHVDLVERQIRRDIPGEVDDLVVHVEQGEPVDVILRIAAREDCPLIIVGTSGPSFASIISHTTTEQLLRSSPRSLLVVKARPRDAYREILVGTDFTVESRYGLETAAAWFADADFTLMHALDIPYRSLFLSAGRESEFARLEHETMTSFVADAHLSDATRRRIGTRIAYGYPEAMLSEYAMAHEVDLTVIGALTRGLAFRMLVGGNAARIVQTIPGDILVVRAEGPPADESAERAA